MNNISLTKYVLAGALGLVSIVLGVSVWSYLELHRSTPPQTILLGEGDKVDIKNTATPAQASKGVSFKIKSEFRIDPIDVFVSTDKSYKASIITRSFDKKTKNVWNLVDSSSLFCFKKDTYIYFYCLNDKFLSTETSGIEREVNGILPGNELLAFLYPINAAIKNIDSLKNGYKLTETLDKQSITLGTVTDLRIKEDSIALPSKNSFDFTKFVKLLKDTRSPTFAGYDLRFAETDDHMIEIITMDSLLSMDDFSLTSGPIPLNKVYNVERRRTIWALQDILEEYRNDHKRFPIANDLETLKQELSAYSKDVPHNIKGEYYFSYNSSDGKDYTIVYQLYDGGSRTTHSND